MDIILRDNEVNRIEKGTVILSIGESVRRLCLVLKGKVLVKNKGLQVIAGVGSFIGVSDLFVGSYQASYIALDNLAVFVFPVSKADDIYSILDSSKDYRGFAVASQSRMIKEINKLYTALLNDTRELYDFIRTFYQKYQNEGSRTGYAVMAVPLLSDIGEFEHESFIAVNVTDYYIECTSVPLEVQKEYYGHSTGICMHHIKEQADIIVQMMMECEELTEQMHGIFNGLIANEGPNLFSGLSQLALAIDRVGGKNTELINMIDEIVDKINSTEQMLAVKIGRPIRIDRSEMEETYFKLLSGGQKADDSCDMVLEDREDHWEEIENELKDSLNKILSYSEIPKEMDADFREKLKAFTCLEDLAGGDEKVRKTCRALTVVFYDVYEAVFRRAYREKDKGKLINLFLNFGFIDERLLNKEQLMELYQFDGDQEPEGPCRIYSIRQWLTEIYEMKKEPSKNEFDLNFDAYIREQVQTKRFTQEEGKKYSEDPDYRLSYEIKNMFAYNNRVVSGRMGSFVPVLYADAFTKPIHKIYHNARDINAVINRIKMVDYSVFYRESLYVDKEKGIVKEYIMEEVFPDIILLPVVGSKGAMWQEITGKKRNTPGRFLLPIFTEVEPENILIALMGRFRWELCRTIQGTSWSDIKYPSLTAEYSDYIQFYRKNKDLTEEKKEKLKLQIQRARGSSREVFVTDYIIWINFEAKGSLRLNKIVRGIMASYCPFSREMREKLVTQPLFAEAMAKNEREKAKKVRELDLRMRALQKENVQITEEILDTMKYYKEM